MIRYALKCDQDHAFESWFQNADAFEALRAAGHLACAVCGSGTVEKAIMAPRVSVSPADEVAPDAPPAAPALSAPHSEVERMLREMRRKVEENSDYVGRDFVKEARAMHDGDAPERAIWGEAKPADAKALIDEGVPVAPLPFMPNRKAN